MDTNFTQLRCALISLIHDMIPLLHGSTRCNQEVNKAFRFLSKVQLVSTVLDYSKG